MPSPDVRCLDNALLEKQLQNYFLWSSLPISGSSLIIFLFGSLAFFEDLCLGRDWSVKEVLTCLHTCSLNALSKEGQAQIMEEDTGIQAQCLESIGLSQDSVLWPIHLSKNSFDASLQFSIAPKSPSLLWSRNWSFNRATHSDSVNFIFCVTPRHSCTIVLLYGLPPISLLSVCFSRLN